MESSARDKDGTPPGGNKHNSHWQRVRSPCVIFVIFVSVITVMAGTASTPRVITSDVLLPIASSGSRGTRDMNRTGDGSSINASSIDMRNISRNISRTKPAKSDLHKALGIVITLHNESKSVMSKLQPALPKLSKPDQSKHKPAWVPCTDLRFASPHFPKTALATFPGSGNTWTRHLIQQLTGYYTGAVYNDLVLKKNGFKGEYIQDGRVIVIKTHLTRPSDRRRYSKAIIVMRSPEDALLAEFKRESRSHTGQPGADAFHSPAWEKFTSKQMSGWLHWLNWHKFWFQLPGKKLVVFYEDMLADLKPVLKQFCDFLGVSKVCTEERLKCVLDNAAGNFKRKKSKTVNVDPFSKDQHIALERQKKEAYALLNTCIDRGDCICKKVKT